MPEAMEDEDAAAKREAFLISLSHPRSERSSDGIQLVAPSRYTREFIREAVLTVCARPQHDPDWLRVRPMFVVEPIPVKKLVVFRE